MVSLYRGSKVLLFFLAVSSICGAAAAQQETYIDTLYLVPHEPDSVYVRSEGKDIVVGWYPPPDSIGSGLGSLDLTNWIVEHDPSEVSTVTLSGVYRGDVDRMITFQKEGRNLVFIGGTGEDDRSIILTVETIDAKQRTYRNTDINIGSDYYNPGDPIAVILYYANDEAGIYDTLETGVSLSFGEGLIDTNFVGGGASFKVDFQHFEGFHVWRGNTPYPSDMEIIVDLSREDAAEGFDFDSTYYAHWPQYDALGRAYYEYTDENAFAGFTYYYVVTCYDRGYFFGRFQHNKWDNYICEDPDTTFTQYYEHEGDTVLCEDAATKIVKSVLTGTNMKAVYVVPNPYRTGTSAVVSPYYHNFPDRTIKFFNVPREADIKVYTVSGDLVWEKHHSSPDGMDGVVSWDVRNREGQDVTSGVYIYKCENSGNGDSMYGRIVVIR